MHLKAGYRPAAVRRYDCEGSPAAGLAPLMSGECPICGSMMQAGGPLWLGHLHDYAFCESVISKLNEQGSDKHAIKLVEMCKDKIDAPHSMITIESTTQSEFLQSRSSWRSINSEIPDLRYPGRIYQEPRSRLADICVITGVL